MDVDQIRRDSKHTTGSCQTRQRDTNGGFSIPAAQPSIRHSSKEAQIRKFGISNHQSRGPNNNRFEHSGKQTQHLGYLAEGRRATAEANRGGCGRTEEERGELGVAAVLRRRVGEGLVPDRRRRRVRSRRRVGHVSSVRALALCVRWWRGVCVCVRERERQRNRQSIRTGGPNYSWACYIQFQKESKKKR